MCDSGHTTGAQQKKAKGTKLDYRAVTYRIYYILLYIDPSGKCVFLSGVFLANREATGNSRITAAVPIPNCAVLDWNAPMSAFLFSQTHCRNQH